jgi:hypothetical protein
LHGTLAVVVAELLDSSSGCDAVEADLVVFIKTSPWASRKFRLATSCSIAPVLRAFETIFAPAVHRNRFQTATSSVANVQGASNSVSASVIMSNVDALASTNRALVFCASNTIVTSRVLRSVLAAMNRVAPVQSARNIVITPFITSFVDAVQFVVTVIFCALISVVAQVIVDVVEAATGITAFIQSAEHLIVAKLVTFFVVASGTSNIAPIKSTIESIIATFIVRNVGAFAKRIVTSIISASNFIIAQRVCCSVDASSSCSVTGINSARDFIRAVLLNIITFTIAATDVLSAFIAIVTVIIVSNVGAFAHVNIADVISALEAIIANSI